MTQINIPEEIFEALEIVRGSEETNMFDRNGVQVVANKYGYYKLVVFIENNRDRYDQILEQFSDWKRGNS